MRICLYGAVALMFFIGAVTSCKKSAGPGSGPDVYVAGYNTTKDGGIEALYWKNGTAFPLGKDAMANSIFVSGNDIYVAGVQYSNGTATATFWKNGVGTALTGSATAARSFANSIFVDGQDVYVAGYVLLNSGIGTAMYWKNGLAVNLTALTAPYPAPPNPPPINTIGLFRLSDYATAFSVFVSGGDVYVAGIENYFRPAFWKNGSLTELADTNLMATANSIYVNGTDVYVAGSLGDSAVYWKNQTLAQLTDVQAAEAYAITISGSTVYAAGGEDGISQYWKNGLPTTLETGDAWASSIFILGSDIYVCGGTYAMPKYWKNGIVTNLPVEAYGNASANSIFVVRR